MMQLGPQNIRTVITGAEYAVGFQFRVQMVSHFLGHIRVGIQLISQHMRGMNTILESAGTDDLALREP